MVEQEGQYMHCNDKWVSLPKEQTMKSSRIIKEPRFDYLLFFGLSEEEPEQNKYEENNRSITVKINNPLQIVVLTIRRVSININLSRAELPNTIIKFQEGDCSGSTKVKYRNKNPVWEEEINLEASSIQEVYERKVILQVTNRNFQMSKIYLDQPMAEIEIKVKDLFNPGQIALFSNNPTVASIQQDYEYNDDSLCLKCEIEVLKTTQLPNLMGIKETLKDLEKLEFN